MDEIREAALAYYDNMPDHLKNLASAKFKEIDSDHNGTISRKEFRNSLSSSFDDNSKIMRRCFKELDKDGDDKLDFNEYITLYYLLKSDRLLVFCSGHGCESQEPFLKGLYFTCVDCFHNDKEGTFDLCTSCYRNREFAHEHTNFLDNYVLLRSKAACCHPSIEPCSSGSDSESNQSSRSGSKRVTMNRPGSNMVEVVGAIESGASFTQAVGNVASDASDIASYCSIM